MVSSLIVKDANDLASVIVALPFAALMDVAKHLVEMNEDPDVARDTGTPLGMAETLSDWAEAHLEDHQ